MGHDSHDHLTMVIHDHPWSNKPLISHRKKELFFKAKLTSHFTIRLALLGFEDDRGRQSQMQLTTEWMFSFLGYAGMRTYHAWQQFTRELIVSLHCDREPKMEAVVSRVNSFPCGRDAYVGKLRDSSSSNIKNWLYKLWLPLSVQTRFASLAAQEKQFNRMLIVVHILARRVEHKCCWYKLYMHPTKYPYN